MRDKLIIALLLLLSFFVSFTVTTAITDSYDKSSGYYSQGIDDSNSIGR